MRLSWELSRCCCWSADAPMNEAEAEVEEGGGAANADMLLLFEALSSSRRGSVEVAIDGDISLFLVDDDEGCEAKVVEEAPACTP